MRVLLLSTITRNLLLGTSPKVPKSNEQKPPKNTLSSMSFKKIKLKTKRKSYRCIMKFKHMKPNKIEAVHLTYQSQAELTSCSSETNRVKLQYFLFPEYNKIQYIPSSV